MQEEKKSNNDNNSEKGNNDNQQKEYEQSQLKQPKKVDKFENFVHFYDRGDEWKDIKPIPQFSEQIEIIKIQFNKCYQEIMDYFRGILAVNEISLRAYNLTTEVLIHNPTNYAAWYHRRLCIDNIPSIDLSKELAWLDSIIIENQKNYQIWNHRKLIIDKINDGSNELKILNKVFDNDAKNFHAWCHRIWIIRRFNNFEGEMEYIELMLKNDIKNNSVWNYRFFLVNYLKEKSEDDKTFITREINYALKKIEECKINESAYSYIRGMLTKFKYNYSDFPQIKNTLLLFNKESLVNHLMSMLLDIYEEEKNKEEALAVIEELINLDYIRKKYWGWRKDNLKF